MEARRITIIQSRNNSKSVINSTAETLGELKRDLAQAGIDYTDMVFYEGLTKTELKEDGALLPRDVRKLNPTTGQVDTTNELAFMLTLANKNIKSGGYTRADLYAAIREKGLQQECVRVYGKNFTQCKTDELATLLLGNSKKESVKTKKDCNCSSSTKSNNSSLKDAFLELISILEEDYELHSVKAIFEGCKKQDNKPLESPYSDDQLNEMFAGKL